MSASITLPQNKKPGGDRERLEIRAPADWIDRVTDIASRLGLSLSAYVRLAVNERLAKDEASAPEVDAPKTRRRKSE